MKVFKRVIFVVWVVAIAILSIVPHANEAGGLSFKLTDSGMGLHFVAYFVSAALFYWAYSKVTLFSILFSCFSIFMLGVVLEFVQLYLPYRSFNPVDIAANGFGVGFFVVCWAVFFRRRKDEKVRRLR